MSKELRLIALAVPGMKPALSCGPVDSKLSGSLYRRGLDLQLVFLRLARSSSVTLYPSLLRSARARDRPMLSFVPKSPHRSTPNEQACDLG